MNIPAAAAGSAPPFFADSGAGLPEERRPRGDLLRRESTFLAGGDRERLSNLEVLFGSGSFWSKRDRFAVRRSVSSILIISLGLSIELLNDGQYFKGYYNDPRIVKD